jgi:hypothetical protein
MRKHAYRLHAAFFHRGSAGGGHYWVYIFDHVKEVWRKYNDDRVTVVHNRNEIFGNPYAQGQFSVHNPPPNPYLLIYLDEKKIDTLADTVHRDIVFPPPDEPPPIPARNPPQSQMAAMPPAPDLRTGSFEGDVEMLEYAQHDGEHAHHAPIEHDTLAHPVPSQPNKDESSCTWDNSELITDRPVKW